MTRVLLLLVSLVAATPVAAQEPRSLLGPASADALFDDSVVHDITLTINKDDWQTLKARYLEDTYYPADFRWRNNVVRNVGIKSRGSGSRSGTKPGLKVDLSKDTSDQTFMGLKSIVLRNNTQDPSNLRERLSMLLYRRMGIPAPREVHARLFINGEFAGLYTIVESLDKPFLRNTFGDDSGWLYKYDYPADAAPFYFEDRGLDPGAYVPTPFSPETHSSDPRGDIIASWVQAINDPREAVWRTLMAGFIDLGAFLRFVAIEAYLGDDDGVLGNWGMNNFYTYRFPGTSTFTLLPWDKSDTFPGPYGSVWHNIVDVPPQQQNRLVNRALNYRDLRASWLASLEDCITSSLELDPAQPEDGGWLAREIEREYAQIHAAALADPVKPFTNEAFEDSVNALRVFAQERPGFVAAEIAADRARTGLRPKPLPDADR